MNYLVIENMRYHAFHGVMSNENMIGGEYSVSFKIGYDFEKASLTDDIHAAIDYGYVYKLVEKEMKQSSQLIEHVAQRIQTSMLKNFPSIQSLETIVCKYNPPIEGVMDCAKIILNYNKE